MNERDYQRKKNKFLPKIHTWYVQFFPQVYLCFYELLSPHSLCESLWLFGIVAAGEVHPQPQFLMFGNAPTIIFQ
jgi:hypothetical protein